MSRDLLILDGVSENTAVYQAILNNLSEGTFLLDGDNQILHVNQTALKIIGLPREQVLGEQIGQVLTNKIDLILRDIGSENTVDEIYLGEGVQQRPYHVQYIQLTGSFDKPLYLLTLRDISSSKMAAQELRTQKELFANMISVARITARDVGLHHVLQNAIDIATTITKAQWGSLLLVNSDLTLKESILSRSKATPLQRADIINQVLTKGVAAWVIEHYHPALIHDAEQDERWLHLPDQPYIVRSVLSVPIISDTEVVGVLTLQHAEKHHFTPEHAGLLQAAADQIALVIHNAQIYETQHRLADQQAILHGTLRTISGRRNTSKVVHNAVETIQKLTGWTAVSLFLLNNKGDQFILRAASDSMAAVEGDMINLDCGAYGKAFQQEETVIDNDPDGNNCPIIQQFGFQSVIATPLNYRDHKFGVLAAYNDGETLFSPNDSWLMEALAEAIALAIANARLFNSIIDERGRLQALIQANRDGIILAGMDQHILVMNEHAVEFLRLDKPASVWVNQPLKRSIANLASEEPAAFKAIMGEVEKIREGDETIGEGEFEIQNRIIYWSATPVMVDANPIGRLLVLRDVSQERQIEKLREDLIQTTVHDLRNPLGAAFAATEFLEDMLAGKLDEDATQLIELARRSTGKALALVNTILDINQLESGHMPIKCTLLRVQDVVQEVVKGHEPLANAKRIHIVNGVPSSLPFAWADDTLIERVVQNLLGNALKFTMAEGTVRIDAFTKTNASGKHVLYVSVSDTGSGIPADVRQNIFDKFTTGTFSGNGRSYERGSGLGLAFCKMALEAHNQDIWLEESSSSGTTFTFTLATSPSD